MPASVAGFIKTAEDRGVRSSLAATPRPSTERRCHGPPRLARTAHASARSPVPPRRLDDPRLCTAIPLATLAVVLSALGTAAAEPDFAVIDAHVAGIERPASGNITEFVQRLVKPARSDLERVRAIAWWLASHIEYDHDIHRVGVAQQRSGQAPLQAIAANKPPEVMRRGKAVCSGYAALFVACCRTIGVEAVEIGGSSRYNDEGHQWNAVRIDGVWRLLDISFMASGAGNSRQGRGRPIDFYFLTPPEKLIFSHFPRDPKWQLLSTPLSRREFDQVPAVPPALLMMIDQPLQLRQAAQRGVREYVPTALPESTSVTFLDIPLERRLTPGRPYRFRIRAKDCSAILVKDGERVQSLDRRGNVFEGQVVPGGPFLRVGLQRQDADGGIAGILDYEVSGRRPAGNETSIDDEIGRLINDARRDAGVKPLARDAALDTAATAHAEEMARHRATPPRPSCLVAAVDAPAGGLDTDLARRFVGSMIEDPGRRSWACAPMHARVGIGSVHKEGRVYFCIEFR
jgi:hypothetical protein